MKWYERVITRTAAKPPAYLMERVSDLEHACHVSKTSPREANVVISNVISELSKHHDTDFIPPLKEAGKIMLDNPFRAREAINKIVGAMIAEKELLESEREEKKSWKTKL